MPLTAAQIRRPLPQGLDPHRYLINVRRQNGVDRELLEMMIRRVGVTEGSIVLCGWSDYAKHLVNIFGEFGDVLAIADDAPFRQGWTFRGIPVVPLDEAVSRHPAQFVCSHVDDRVLYLSEVTHHPSYHDQPVHCYPPPSTPEGQFFDPWKHSRFYRQLNGAHESGDTPGTMLTPSKVQLLLEMLKQTLHLSGDVIEIGAWQGGSAWALGRLLSATALGKRLVLLDFFEELTRINPEGIMCVDEIRYWFSFYPGTDIHSGNVDEHPEPIERGEWCFIHYDAGFEGGRLERCFSRLQTGGIMVLDNYGHIAGNPGQFDRWFAKRGHTVSSPPGSEQGWLIKHA